jgi:hypothetical protein
MFLAIASCNSDSQPPKADGVLHEKTMWPTLPMKGFIKGRTATKEDIASGDAAFLTADSRAMNIEIPQYALHIDARTGKRSPGIIIQAERTPEGKELVAMQRIGEVGQLVGLLGEYKLLGKVPPEGD